MVSFLIFSRLYRFLAPRKRILFALMLGAMGISALAFRGVALREDVAALLPDDGSDVARDFKLLQEAPFSRKVLIELRSGQGVDTEELIASADRLSRLLSPAFLRPLAAGSSLQGPEFFSWVLGALPHTATADDMAAIEAELRPDRVRARLREAYGVLLSPEGWALKGAVRSDPLALRNLTLAKLRHLNLVPRMTMRGGHFVSKDGKAVLLIADSPVPMTDSAGAAAMLAHFRRAASQALSPGVTTSLVSGHRYTLANAEAVKGDLAFVLSLSSIAVLAIYVGYLRSRWAVFVFLVPASVLILASGFLALLYGNVLAATIGFGGVLLGIADEYAMHVYFALRRGARPPDEILGQVSRPVIFGGLATLASFAVMLLSRLPGQRQLGVYAMTGIVASLAVSLVVLPHLVPPSADNRKGSSEPRNTPRRSRRWVVAAWLVFLALCGSQVGKLRFDGDLRAIGMVPADLRAEEEALQSTWGNLRGKALAFAEGRDLGEALAANDRLFAFLQGRVAPEEVVSLAPLVPSPLSQASSRERWLAFWTPDRVRNVRAVLAQEGGALGFSPDAFAPFLDSLSRPPESDNGPAALVAAGLGEVVGSLLLQGPEGVKVVTLLPDSPEVLALLDGPQAPQGIHLVSQSRFADAVSKAIGQDFFTYLAATCSLVTILAVLLFRRPRKFLLALVPALTGLLATFGIMGLLGIHFNLFNIVATVLIIGLCADYGIYMVCRITDEVDHAGERAVLVSGLTTLAGFGVLVLARHPAMYSVGLTVLLGIGAAIPTALFVIPALWESLAREQRER